MRGIIPAGEWADATDLCSATPVLPKSLLPVHDQPMIYHPISLLLLAGIRHILVVSTPAELPHFQQCLGDGEPWGIHLSYAVRPAAGGAIQALFLASEFVAGQPVSLALGDHLLYGHSLPATLQQAATLKKGARIFSHPASGDALPGLGFYDHTAAARARELASSGPGRLTITDLNNTYLADGALEVLGLGEEVTWLDINTRESLSAAAGFIHTVEKNRGVKAGCPEEAAWRMGFIGDEQLLALAYAAEENHYGRYLRQLPEGRGRSC